MGIITKLSKNGRGQHIPERIILHSMSELFEHENKTIHASDFLEKIGLSAHYLICPSGEIMQTKLDTDIAYHAKNHNTGSIGIEFLVEGKHTYASFVEAIKSHYLSFAQHVSGVELMRELCSKHNMTEIVRHSDVSPSYKVDPGDGFAYEQILKDVKAIERK